MDNQMQKIIDLAVRQAATVQGDITEVRQPKEITDKATGAKHTVQECVLEDSSGSIILNLWDGDCNAYAVGDRVKVTKGWVSEFRETLRLARGKYGTIEKIYA